MNISECPYDGTPYPAAEFYPDGNVLAERGLQKPERPFLDLRAPRVLAVYLI